jgi:HSP20 family protein
MAGTMVKTEPRPKSSWLRPRNVFQEMEEMLSQVVGTEPEAWFTGRIVPALDLVESDGAIEVKMDLPGMKAEDIDIQVNGNLLTISGERKEEKEEKGKSYHRIERRTGTFSRSVTLPCQIAEKKIDAKYENGTLTVSMPKSDEAKGTKIAVKG